MRKKSDRIESSINNWAVKNSEILRFIVREHKNGMFSLIPVRKSFADN